MTKRRVFGNQNFCDARNPGCSLARCGGRGPAAERSNIAQFGSRSDRLGCGVDVQFAISDFGKEKNSHHTAPASLSFETSSSTEPTISPALRVAGSAVPVTVRRGVTSTP